MAAFCMMFDIHLLRDWPFDYDHFVLHFGAWLKRKATNIFRQKMLRTQCINTRVLSIFATFYSAFGRICGLVGFFIHYIANIDRCVLRT